MDHAWNPQLDLGNAALDHDHHTQIALVAAFADAVEQGRPALARRLGEQGRPALARRLGEQLGDYSRAHFRSEELLMSAAGYADAASHAKDHDMLLARIADVNAAQAEGNSELAVSLALDFRTELAKHIANADQRVAAAAPSHR